MLTVYIRNISKLAPVSDYEYLVFVNSEQIAKGTVKGHKRSDGWQKLVETVAKGEYGERDSNK